MAQVPYMMLFDQVALRRMAAMTRAVPQFAGYTLTAMRYSVNLVNEKTQANAPVLTGTLRRAVQGQVESPWLGRVGVLASVPYATRREFGFDNQTDRLGRYYALDPKDPTKRENMMYLHRALDDSKPAIAAAFRASVTLTFNYIIND